MGRLEHSRPFVTPFPSLFRHDNNQKKKTLAEGVVANTVCPVPRPRVGALDRCRIAHEASKNRISVVRHP
jgi:hypothetical protein